MNKPINTQTHKYINAQTLVYVLFCAFMFFFFYAFVFSLPFFAILCLIKEKQSTRARYESLTKSAYYCGPSIESLGTGT